MVPQVDDSIGSVLSPVQHDLHRTLAHVMGLPILCCDAVTVTRLVATW